jgi:hypothetical protein
VRIYLIIIFYSIFSFSCKKSLYNFNNHTYEKLSVVDNDFSNPTYIPKPIARKALSLNDAKDKLAATKKIKRVKVKTLASEVQIKRPPKEKLKKRRVKEDLERGKKLGDLSLKISSVSALSGLLYLLFPILWPLVFIWMFGSVIGWGALRKRRKDNLNAVIGLILGSGVILFFLMIGIFVLLYLTSGFGVTS